jgi:DNA repair exonuclease SbcCD nuclease subunit
MKIALLGDTHWGCRNDLGLFYEYFQKFYDDFIEYCLKNNITQIFQLGDLFDRRKYINFKTLSESKRILFDKLKANNLTMHVLVGNHDIYYRDTLDIVNFDQFLKEYDNIKIYNKATILELEDTRIDIIPWICSSNSNDIFNFISNSTSDICLGHFEIQNFEMYRGMPTHDGIEPSYFEKYERVFSGHFHTRSTKGNITYVGTPYEMTWQDYADTKGFHTFDLKTRELNFIENPYRIFHKIYYDDNELNLIPESLENCFVKVIVVNKTNLYEFDNFINNLYKKSCYEIKIIEDLSDYNDTEISSDVDIEDTMSILNNYISSLDLDHDKSEIQKFMKTLYIEAINSEAYL